MRKGSLAQLWSSATGVALGLLLVFPPPFLAPIGFWRFPLALAIPCVFLLLSTIRTLRVNFPRELALEPRPEGPPPVEVQALLDQYRDLGFQSIGPPLRIGRESSGEQWYFFHPVAHCCGSVFCTNNSTRKVGFDLVSILEGRRGRLVSVADPRAAVLPLPSGIFRQVLRGATPRDLLEFHLAAQKGLAGRGLRFETEIPFDVEERVRWAMADYRQTVMANVVASAALVLWRVATKKSPFDGPIEKQKGFAKSLRGVGVA